MFSRFGIYSCKDIPRDNILDPKNPSSKQDKVLLLEAFVNTSHHTPYNYYVLHAIETLSMDENLKDRLIFIEYHRDAIDSSDA